MRFGWMTIVGVFGMLGASVAFFVMLGAVPVLIYGFCARRPRRGLIASRVALWLAGAAVVMSVPLWIVEASWRLGGRSLIGADPSLPPFRVFAAVEIAVAVLAWGSVWRWRRRPQA